jgi:hypothetical protein
MAIALPGRLAKNGFPVRTASTTTEGEEEGVEELLRQTSPCFSIGKSASADL